MEADLRTTAFYASLTLQCNWIAKGVSNIVLGSLADRLGRKPVLVASMLLYILVPQPPLLQQCISRP